MDNVGHIRIKTHILKLKIAYIKSFSTYSSTHTHTHKTFNFLIYYTSHIERINIFSSIIYFFITHTHTHFFGIRKNN